METQRFGSSQMLTKIGSSLESFQVICAVYTAKPQGKKKVIVNFLVIALSNVHFEVVLMCHCVFEVKVLGALKDSSSREMCLHLVYR